MDLLKLMAAGAVAGIAAATSTAVGFGQGVTGLSAVIAFVAALNLMQRPK